MYKLKLILLATLVIFTFSNCASFRMSEQKQKEITAGPHGMLSIKMPNGKKVDGYDKKWRLFVMVDSKPFVEDDFADDEAFSTPIPAGEHTLSVTIKRTISRPFRCHYEYSYSDFAGKKLNFEQGKLTSITFNIPEKKLGVGGIIGGILLPVVPVFGWPSGNWPNKYADLELVMDLNTGVAK